MSMEHVWVGPGSKRERTTMPLLSGWRRWDCVQELGQEEGGATALCQDWVKTILLLFWDQASKKLARHRVEEPEDVLIFWLQHREAPQKMGRAHYY